MNAGNIDDGLAQQVTGEFKYFDTFSNHDVLEKPSFRKSKHRKSNSQTLVDLPRPVSNRLETPKLPGTIVIPPKKRIMMINKAQTSTNSSRN